MIKAKEHTGSFFLSEEVLAKLDLIAEFEKVSRSIIIERIILAREVGYEKAKRKVRKKTKKVQVKNGKHQEAKPLCQKRVFIQKCLFEPRDYAVF